MTSKQTATIVTGIIVIVIFIIIRNLSSSQEIDNKEINKDIEKINNQKYSKIEYEQKINNEVEIDNGDKFRKVSQDGDIVIGYIERESRNQEFLKIGNEYKVLNIDESGNLKWHADELVAGCSNDEWCEKNRFFEMIKKIPYQTDPEEGWKYDMKPIEVLNYKKGDCDERSFTLASLLLEKKYKAVIVYTNNNHAFVCININNNKNINAHHAKLRINGLDYYYAETTDQNAYIGAYNKIDPKDFIGVYDINKRKLINKKEIEFYKG